MKTEFAAQALRVYVGDDDKWKGGLLYPAIVLALKEAGLAGVTVFAGAEGFGSHAKLHTPRLEALFQGLPVVIEAVDTPDKIASAMPILDDMVLEGLVTVQDLNAIRYRKR